MSTIYDFRCVMKELLMTQLYKLQIEYWNKAFNIVADKNAQNHGRCERYNVYYNNKRYYPLVFEWCDEPINPNQFCLPMHTDFPEELEDMKEIASEMDEITDEKYETERFLAGLITFPAPPEIFAEILGDTLYSTIAGEMEEHAANYEYSSFWNARQEVSLRTFMENKNYIVQAMRQRILLNLITLD